MLSIEHAAYYIPVNHFSIDDKNEWLGISVQQAKIYKRYFGLGHFPVAESMSSYDLVERAMLQMPQVMFDEVDTIKYIIHAHTAQVLLPFGSAIVNKIRSTFGLKQAIYFGTSINNCASIFTAFEMAKNLLCVEKDNARALILVGDVTFTQSLRIIPHASIAGDAAACVMVNKHSSDNQLIAISTSYHGEYAQGVWAEHEEVIKFEANFMRLLKNIINQTLKKAQLNWHDIALILPHNINRHVWLSFAKEADFPFEKIYTENIVKYAHCFGADVIINLVDVMHHYQLKKGDYYLMLTAGLGVTLGAALFQY